MDDSSNNTTQNLAVLLLAYEWERLEDLDELAIVVPSAFEKLSAVKAIEFCSHGLWHWRQPVSRGWPRFELLRMV